MTASPSAHCDSFSTAQRLCSASREMIRERLSSGGVIRAWFGVVGDMVRIGDRRVHRTGARRTAGITHRRDGARRIRSGKVRLRFHGRAGHVCSPSLLSGANGVLPSRVPMMEVSR